MQNAAEVLKTCGGAVDESAALMYGGTYHEDAWIIHYNEHWEQVEGDGTYMLIVEPMQGESALVGMADIRMFSGETCLLQMDVAWQEVSPDA